LTVKLANRGTAAVEGFVLLFDPAGTITFDQGFSVAPSHIVDIVAPTVVGQFRVPIIFVPQVQDVFCNLSIDLFQIDPANNVMQIPDRSWIGRDRSVLGASSIVFGPRRMGHFDFIGALKEYSPGPIRAAFASALLSVFNYGAVPVAVETACLDPVGVAIAGCILQATIPALQTRIVSLNGLPQNFYPILRASPATVLATLLVLQQLGSGQQIFHSDWQRTNL